MRSASYTNSGLLFLYAIAVLLIVSIMVFLTTTKAQAIATETVITKINTHRLDEGLTAFVQSEQLAASAEVKAQHMIEHNYWDHYAEDGTSPWYFIRDAGFDYSAAGENLAKGFSDENRLVEAWMNSPTHRANKLHSSYTHTGVGVAKGELNGKTVTIVVVHFAAQKQSSTEQTQGVGIPQETNDNWVFHEARKLTEALQKMFARLLIIA